MACYSRCKESLHQKERCRCACQGKSHGVRCHFWTFCATCWRAEKVGKKDDVLFVAKLHLKDHPDHRVCFGHETTWGYLSAEVLKERPEKPPRRARKKKQPTDFGTEVQEQDAR